MNYLLSGGYNPKKLELLLSLTSIRSDDIKAAIYDHLVRGFNIDLSSSANLVDPANLKRALNKLNEVARVCEEVKNIDLYKTVSKVTDFVIKGGIVSKNPLTALADVMRQHSLEIQTIDGITIAYSDGGIVCDIDKSDPITANDIEPEIDNENKTN